jgi:nucleoside-diphosphate-sugar epimerase
MTDTTLATHGLGGASEPVCLVTGYPGFRARRVLEAWLAREKEARARVVVPPRQLELAAAALGALPPDQQARVGVLEGDTSHLDLGLSGAEYRGLAAELTHIEHCHQVLEIGTERAAAESVNIGGMREVLELGRAAARIQSIVVYSSASVSGNRTGLVLEDELNAGQSFPDVVSETLGRAERMARQAMAELPLVVLRPTHVVGDATTGETGELDGLYVLFLFALSSADDWANGPEAELDLPLDMIPVDYLVHAARHLGRSVGRTPRTYHLSNPRPPSVRRVAELLRTSRERLYPGASIAPDTARAFLSIPASRLFARGHRAVIETLATRARYDTHHADQTLRPAAIACPPFEAYVDRLVAHLMTRLLGRPPRPRDSQD